MLRTSISICSLSAILFIALLLPSCATSETEVSVQVQTKVGGNVVGTVILIGKDRTTRYEMRFHGLLPNENYLVTLHGGSCENQSASFTRLSEIMSDKEGNGNSRGRLLFRDRNEIELKSIADGTHAMVIKSENLVACGIVPAIDN